MKRMILSTTLAMAFAATGFAQQPGAQQPDTQPPAPVQRTHAPDPARETARMTKRLNLTPDEAAKVEPILADREQRIAAIRNDATLSPDQKTQQIKQVHKSAQAQLRGVLTPDQMQQMRTEQHGEPQSQQAPPAN